MARDEEFILPGILTLKGIGEEAVLRYKNEKENKFQGRGTIIFACYSCSSSTILLLTIYGEGFPMNKNQILNMFAWISLIIGIILVIWFIFGDSPTEFYIALPFISTFFFKFWTLSNDVSYLKGDYNRFKENTRKSFNRTKDDVKEVKGDLKEIKRLVSKRK